MFFANLERISRAPGALFLKILKNLGGSSGVLFFKSFEKISVAPGVLFLKGLKEYWDFLVFYF